MIDSLHPQCTLFQIVLEDGRIIKDGNVKWCTFLSARPGALLVVETSECPNSLIYSIQIKQILYKNEEEGIVSLDIDNPLFWEKSIDKFRKGKER